MKVPNSDNQIVPANFFYSGFSKGIKLTLASGETISTTIDHPLLKNNYYVDNKSVNHNEQFHNHMNDYDWYSVTNINEGDYIKMPLGINLYGNNKLLNTDVKLKYNGKNNVILPDELTKELSEFIGIYTADGSYTVSNGSFNISISNSNQEVLNRVSQLVKNVFNIDGTINNPSNRVSSFRFSSKLVGKFLMKNFDLKHKAYLKEIPDIIMSASKENQVAFVRGLSLDTSISKKSYPSVYFETSSYNQARYLHAMLNNMGILANMRYRKSYREDVRGNYDISITNSYASKYVNSIGFVESVKTTALMSKIESYTYNKAERHQGYLIDGSNIFVKVVKKEYIDNEEFFDLNVPEGSSFVANTIYSHNTETTRMSSSSPNMQQLPRYVADPEDITYEYQIKSALIPYKEYGHDTLVLADFSSQEVHLAAVLAHDDNMIEDFINGEDVHTTTASMVYHVKKEDVTPELRTKAKAVTYGLLYGETPESFAPKQHDPEMTLEESKELFDSYFSSKPKIKQLIEDAKTFVEKNGYAVIPGSGFRRKLQEVNSSMYSERSKALRQSLNSQIQGGASYITQVALINLDKAIRKFNLNAKIFITVHDSIGVSTEKSLVPTVVKVMKYVMENLPMDYLKIEHNGKKIQFKMETEIGVTDTYQHEYDFDEDDFNKAISTKAYVAYYGKLNDLKNRFKHHLMAEDEYEEEKSYVKLHKDEILSGKSIDTLK